MQKIIIGGVVVVAVAIGLLSLLQQGSPTETSTVDSDMTEEMAAETPSADIAETAIAAPELAVLVQALTASDLVEVLQSEGPFTVFAPMNQGFINLPDGTLDTLLLPENIDDLQAVLSYHVVPGKVMAADLIDGMVVETINGESITINIGDIGAVINNEASVMITDIETTNGVVHMIDTVLLPPTE